MAFKALTVNTPPSDPAHILAEDDAAIYQSIFGSDGVFNIGDKFKVTVLSNNKVRVGNGVLNVGGHIGRTVYGDYTDLTIENGVSGQNRNDIIVAKFTTTGAAGIDTLELSVKKGSAGTSATDPALVQGDIYAGGKLREYPLWRVKIEGLSIVKVEQMYTVNPTNKDLADKIAELSSNMFPVISTKNGITYEKHADGRLYMYGTVGSTDAAFGTIDFPVPFIDTNYRMAATPVYASSSYPTFTVSIQKSSKSRAYIYTRQGNAAQITGVSVDWLAIGRWK